MSEAKGKKLQENLRKVGVICVASGGFSGFFPVAPGTAGSAVGILIIWFLGDIPAVALLALVALITILGVWSAGEACQILKKDDAQQIVIDEIAGVMLTLVGIPV